MKALLITIVFLLLLMNRPITMNEVKKLNKDTYTISIQGYLNENKTLQVARGTRVGDLLELIEKDKETDTSHLNPQEILSDHDLVVIRKKTKDKKVSINSATKEELMTLKGIKNKMAQRILDYRSQSSFKRLEDLKNVKGFGDKLFEKLKDFITL